MRLLDGLRQTTRELHTRIEALPLARALSQGTVQRKSYLTLLGQLHQIHRGLEAGLQQLEGQPPVYQPQMSRCPALTRDLTALGGRVPDQNLEETAKLLALFQAWTETAPRMLLGALYVVEGSRLGSMHLIRPLAQALGVRPEPGCGLDYHLEGVAERFALWKVFQARLEAAVADEHKAEVLAGATATFQQLHDLYAAIEPVESSRRSECSSREPAVAAC